jgi:hypothetical protein
VNRFPGFLVPQPDWIKVFYLFRTLGLYRLLTKTLKFSKNFKISKISKKFKIFIRFQNFLKGERNQLLICGFTESRTNYKMKI